MSESAISESITTPSSEVTGKSCTVGRLISEAEGWHIVEVASSWEGTPYAAVGAGSLKGIKGDCSGSTNKIFIEAGFSYPYKTTGGFSAYVAASGRFQDVTESREGLQAGDILLWPGHMAIYAPFPPGHPKRETGVVRHGRPMRNDFYTAFNERNGTPYGPYNIATFRGDRYRAYRYLLLPGDPKC